MLRCHLATSPHNTSSSWWAVGAVAAIFAGNRVDSHQRISQDIMADFSTRGLTGIATRSPSLIAFRASICQGSGLPR